MNQNLNSLAILQYSSCQHTEHNSSAKPASYAPGSHLHRYHYHQRHDHVPCVSDLQSK